uniref:Sulfotransferase n=1 Tax=Maylandia zebra TaxID=106582 RepID=A0A3P9DGT5_9CICH
MLCNQKRRRIFLTTPKARQKPTMNISLSAEKAILFSRPELFDFHGVSMTHYFTDNWENVQNFQVRPDDILIATYPKAGTTWVSQILDLLYFGQTCAERQKTIPIYERVPFLEIAIPSLDSGKDLADKLPTTPRLIKTHFPVQFVPKSFWEQNCRIVYVARNAKDNMVSYFHFDRMNVVEPEAGEWNNYFQRFLEGQMVFGSWYDHVNGWWKKKQTYSNIHYMFYEDMIEDTEREIDKLCSFLGLSCSAEEKKMISGGVQFDNRMRWPTILQPRLWTEMGSNVLVVMRYCNLITFSSNE